MKNFQKASKQVKQPPLLNKKKRKKEKSSNHDPNRSNENPNVTSATTSTPPSCAPDQRPVSVQSSGNDKRCVFVIKLMRGIEEPSKDLETLKHILEALQLKGLLHSKNAKNEMSHQNFIYDRNNKSSIVVMKPTRSLASSISHGGNESPPSSFKLRLGPHRNTNEVSPARSPRRDRSVSVQSSGADHVRMYNYKRCEVLFISNLFLFLFFDSP